jgi:hypothetical protein
MTDAVVRPNIIRPTVRPRVNRTTVRPNVQRPRVEPRPVTAVVRPRIPRYTIRWANVIRTAVDIDHVWPIKPNATLTYDADDRLERIDYADGSYKDLTYDAEGYLTQVQGENDDGDTITKTLTYTDGLLTGVATVVS